MTTRLRWAEPAATTRATSPHLRPGTEHARVASRPRPATAHAAPTLRATVQVVGIGAGYAAGALAMILWSASRVGGPAAAVLRWAGLLLCGALGLLMAVHTVGVAGTACRTAWRRRRPHGRR